MNNINKNYFKENCGIYKITNIINNKCYIGSSNNLYERFKSHKSGLNNNRHDNPHLQNSFNKHGIENFKYEVLKYSIIDDLFKDEQYYYNLYKENAYNIREIVESNRGTKRGIMPLEQRMERSNRMKGKIPKNIHNLHQNKRIKIAKYVDNNLVKVFDSCKEAAEHAGINSKSFYYYIGERRKMKNKSKYMDFNVKYEYYK